MKKYLIPLSLALIASGMMITQHQMIPGFILLLIAIYLVRRTKKKSNNNPNEPDKE